METIRCKPLNTYFTKLKNSVNMTREQRSIQDQTRRRNGRDSIVSNKVYQIDCGLVAVQLSTHASEHHLEGLSGAQQMQPRKGIGIAANTSW
jgi:hypothetical protein